KTSRPASRRGPGSSAAWDMVRPSPGRSDPPYCSKGPGVGLAWWAGGQTSGPERVGLANLPGEEEFTGATLTDERYPAWQISKERKAIPECQTLSGEVQSLSDAPCLGAGQLWRMGPPGRPRSSTRP